MVRSTECLMKCVMLMLLAVPFVSGCTESMALGKKDTKLDLTKKSTAIMSIKVSNAHVVDHQPFLDGMVVGKAMNDHTQFDIKSPYIKEKDKYNEYLISFDMPPGKYFVLNIRGESEFKILPVPNQAVCFVPIYLPFELKPNEITYLGRIEATIHKRQKDNEIRAGLVFPQAIDQVMAGFSTGTFEVTVSDNYEADLQHFAQEYPVIKNYVVTKSLLPLGKQPNEGDYTSLLGRWK